MTDWRIPLSVLDSGAEEPDAAQRVIASKWLSMRPEAYDDANRRPPHGLMAGSIGDLGTFSFYANKTLACGEGGMVVTNRAGRGYARPRSACVARIEDTIQHALSLDRRIQWFSRPLR